MYKFTKSLTCTAQRNAAAKLDQEIPDVQDCINNMLNKLEKKFGIKFHANTRKEKVNGHLSVKHNNGAHILWIFLYSSNGVHESIRGDKIIKQKNNRVIKFNGTFPTETEIKNALK
jgi:hypothetical protein